MTDVSTKTPPLAEPQFGVAEKAITAFERIHSLKVTIHDLVGTLSPFIQAHRFHHRSRLCLAVKAQGQEGKCIDFEVHSLRPELTNIPEGRIHVCPAGLVEWVVPVFVQGKLAWVFFAGPRFPNDTLTSAFRARPINWHSSPWSKRGQNTDTVGENEAQLILEHLRQLAARLQLWVGDFQSANTAAKSPDAFMSTSLMKRQVAIRRFIEQNYHQQATLDMLAKHLNLSESRTSHAVQQSCGSSFRDLLIQRRLRAAMELLRDSGMSVLQVALATGFTDVAHFHRLFHRRIGVTPAKYRIMGKS